MSNQNEIGTWGKFVGASFLVLFTALPIFLIIGLWPDRMPVTEDHQLYQRVFFHMTLIEGSPRGDTIHINTLLFLIVVAAGFLGSMIHVGASFTNFIGAGKFRRSWIPWYVVKPFTAAGIALTCYFVLQAGLLSGSTGNINPYGVAILAALAGWFTDKATLKLEEIFTVLFKPRDTRPDKITDKGLTVKSVEPAKLARAGENKVIITGNGFDRQKLVVKLDGEVMKDVVTTPQVITFSLKLNSEVHDRNELELLLEDEAGKPLFSKKVAVEEIVVTETEEEAVG